MNKMTIADIAEALGISKTTVSRAISGKGRISAGTTERVLQYIHEHNYTPSAVARGLAEQKTYNIAVVCPKEYEIFRLPYYHSCLYGISEITGSKNYDILISMADDKDFRNLKRAVDNRKIDGVILTRSLMDDRAAQYLKETGMPFVVIGRSNDPEVVQIDNDHVEACRELTSILIGKGCRKLALIGDEYTHTVAYTRLQGFRKAFQSAGIQADESLIYLNADSEQRISDILDELMNRRADGIVCMDEKIAAAALVLCRAKHIMIPGDIKLASFYNSQFLSRSDPAVTALDLDDTRLGAVAAATRLEMIEGKSPGSRFLKNYQIILRESTA